MPKFKKFSLLIFISLIITTNFNILFAKNNSRQHTTPLYDACDKDDVSLVVQLLKKGADVNEQNSSCDECSHPFETPIYAAINNENITLVKLLIDHGASLKVSTPYEGTPLHKSARSGNIELMKLLLDNGADVNANHLDPTATPGEGSTGTALHMTVDQALYYLLHSDYTKSDYEFGKDINLTTDDYTVDMTYLASYQALCCCIKLMVDYGADVNLRRNEDGKNVLHMAAAENDLVMTRYFIDKGSQINVIGNNGSSPLSLALWSENKEIVKYLKKNGADTKTSSVRDFYKHERQNFLHGTISFFAYTTIPLIYLGSSIWLYESKYNDNHDNNWLGTFNAYTLTISLTTVSSMTLGFWLYPKGSGFLGNLNKLIGLIIGAAVGIPLGIVIAKFGNLEKPFKNNRVLYYSTPVVALSTTVFVYSFNF